MKNFKLVAKERSVLNKIFKLVPPERSDLNKKLNLFKSEQCGGTNFLDFIETDWYFGLKEFCNKKK